MCNLQAGLVASLEGQLHGGALEEGNQTYPGYLVLVTSGVGLLLTSKATDAGLLNHAYLGILNSIYTAKLALLILPQVANLLQPFPSQVNLVSVIDLLWLLRLCCKICIGTCLVVTVTA